MIKLARNWVTKMSITIGRMSIQLKLILSFICIILIPIILVSWYLFNDVYLKTIKDLEKKNQYILDIEKTNVANNTAVMERTAQLAVSNNGVKEYLETLEELDTAALIDFKTKTFASFQYFLFNNPNIANIRLYTSNPYVHEFWPIIFNEERIVDKPWYPTVIKQNGVVWWDISESSSDIIQNSTSTDNATGLYVSLLREFKFPDDRHLGVLEVTMEVSNFFQKTFSSVQDSESQMLVIDRSGKAFTNEAAPVFDKLSVEEVMRQFQLHEHETGDSYSFRYNGTPYLIIPSYIDQLDVHLLNVVSLASTLSDVSQTRNTIIIAMIILIALLSFISYFLHSLILKKLQILRESMKKVRKGDFNVDIAITSMDEVGELAFHFRQMLKKINELIVEAVNRQAATKEAELKSLKNQIDAHFLYNTLENLKMLAEIEGQYTISDALTSLGGMMRYNLQWTSNHVRLKDELAHIHNYIAIMNIRYDHSLTLVSEVPPGYMEQEMLKMSLQPLVENAVKHGMRSQHKAAEKLVITIKAYEMNDNIVIEVHDNGDGIEESKLREVNLMIRLEDAEYQLMRSQTARSEREGSGIGLRNVDQRIVMYYGKSHGIRVESVQGSYTKVTMTLPYLILAGGGSNHAQPAHR
ncbi:two-component system sensor histidine kinase YesM [Paenibacillus phyllosphaerae]|uniref:histidine kinase n=1 Tax=Paenibacillus phyllosphaerae TaxID=274593 RepID=A0A7W5AVV6_9BACL|nr:histidine kinase [Paenibacillus phyllosphaerae]MBB3109774.1 two-component system sensor histidine kinase YesM [Paenibacillus phyllosphaerae]